MAQDQIVVLHVIFAQPSKKQLPHFIIWLKKNQKMLILCSKICHELNKVILYEGTTWLESSTKHILYTLSLTLNISRLIKIIRLPAPSSSGHFLALHTDHSSHLFHFDTLFWVILSSSRFLFALQLLENWCNINDRVKDFLLNFLTKTLCLAIIFPRVTLLCVRPCTRSCHALLLKKTKTKKKHFLSVCAPSRWHVHSSLTRHDYSPQECNADFICLCVRREETWASKWYVLVFFCFCYLAPT